jgi:hypothetical protein
MVMGSGVADVGEVLSGGPVSDFSAFVPHVVREDLLARAVGSIACFGRNRTIVDNSPEGLPTNDYSEWNGVYVCRPSVPLSCSQTFNFIMRQTRRLGQKTCIWMHSDAEAGPGVAEGLLEHARRYTAEGRRWGVLWTYYDTLCALNTDLIDVVGDWDTELPQYACDNDYYRRVRLAGWECIDTMLTDVKHEGSATINSDPYRKMVNSVTFPLHIEYYKRKWGGDTGKETFETPFGWPK